MTRVKFIYFFVAVLCLLIILSVKPARSQIEAVPTKVLVRAISRDAKVIGTKVGGARITIREAATGNLLAEGIQVGGTGNTELIMQKPHERGALIFDTPNTAGFLASLDLVRPTVVEITAEGPLEPPQSTYKTSKTLLVVPGQDILGEGVLLEIHGFRISLLAPAENFQLIVNQDLEVLATVTMT